MSGVGGNVGDDVVVDNLAGGKMFVKDTIDYISGAASVPHSVGKHADDRTGLADADAPGFDPKDGWPSGFSPFFATSLQLFPGCVHRAG